MNVAMKYTISAIISLEFRRLLKNFEEENSRLADASLNKICPTDNASTVKMIKPNFDKDIIASTHINSSYINLLEIWSLSCPTQT